MKSKIILQIILVASFFVTLLLYFNFGSSAPDILYQWSMLILASIGTVSFFVIYKMDYKKFHWLSMSTIFVLGYFIVFYQIILLHLFGYEVPKIFFSFIWANENVINKSIGISTLGLLSFYIGASYFRKNQQSIIKTSIGKHLPIKSITLILSFAYLFYILFLINSGSYIYGEYTPDDASGLASYFYKLFKVSLVAAIIVKLSYITSVEKKELSFKKYLSYFGLPLLFLLSWNILFSLFVGDRGPVIFYLLLSFGLYFIRWEKITFYKAIIWFFLLSSFMTIVGEIRQSRYSGIEYKERAISALTRDNDAKSKFFDTLVPGNVTLELALSGRTLNHSIYNVPDKYDYMYGLFQLNYLYSMVPGLSSKINILLFEGDNKFNGSANFITFLIQGNNPHSGEGTSIVADLYLDFGLIGVVVVLFVFGLFIGRNEYKLYIGYHGLTFLWIATLVFFANALYLNRSALLLDLSNIILIYFLIRFNTIFVSYFKKIKYLKNIH